MPQIILKKRTAHLASYTFWHTGIPGLWTQVLDAGLWTLDSGRWTLDAGPWTLDSGRWALDAGPWTPVCLLLKLLTLALDVLQIFDTCVANVKL